MRPRHLPPTDLAALVPHDDLAAPAPGPEDVANAGVVVVDGLDIVISFSADTHERGGVGIGRLDDKPLTIKRHRDAGPFVTVTRDAAQPVAQAGEAIDMLKDRNRQRLVGGIIRLRFWRRRRSW